MENKLLVLLLWLTICKVAFSQKDCEPRLIRLLIGDRYSQESSPYTATLMYQTYKECSKSGIVFLNGPSYQTSSQSYHSQWNDTFCHNQKKNCEQVVYDQYMHTIKVAVEPSTQFTYTFCEDVSANNGCIPSFTSVMPPLSPKQRGLFRTNFLSKQPSNTPLRILFYGDHDLSNSGVITFNSIFKTMETTKFDAFIFLGDYGYEFYQNNGEVGDDYINTLTKINTVAPMAITAGNHEDNYNFQFFNEKFQMPSYSQTQNNYYSFEIGNTHFINLNLHYFNDQVNPPNAENQQKMLKWLEDDLKSVDRTSTPWIIAFGHKMIYCKGSDCENFASDYAEFDTILNKYKADLFISGHKHKFQVMKPMKKGKVASYDISSDNTISNYEGFLTIIQGNGGTSKNDDGVELQQSIIKDLMSSLKSGAPFDKSQQKKAMLFEVDNLGYGILNILDQSNINIQSINSQTQEICYEINIKK